MTNNQWINDQSRGCCDWSLVHWGLCRHSSFRHFAIHRTSFIVSRPMSESEETSGAAAAEQLEIRLPDESNEPRDLAMWAGMLVLLVLIAYWPVTDGKLLWNDARNVQPPAMGMI